MPRVTIRVTLALIALIAGLLGLFRWWNDPAVRYRRNHDPAALWAVLSQRVQNGATVEAVESQLGRGEVCTDPKSLRSLARLVRLLPGKYSQGYEDGDEFRRYVSGPATLINLQFRGGRLVNFDPREFGSPPTPFLGASR